MPLQKKEKSDLFVVWLSATCPRASRQSRSRRARRDVEKRDQRGERVKSGVGRVERSGETKQEEAKRGSLFFSFFSSILSLVQRTHPSTLLFYAHSHPQSESKPPLHSHLHALVRTITTKSPLLACITSLTPFHVHSSKNHLFFTLSLESGGNTNSHIPWTPQAPHLRLVLSCYPPTTSHPTLTGMYYVEHSVALFFFCLPGSLSFWLFSLGCVCVCVC